VADKYAVKCDPRKSWTKYGAPIWGWVEVNGGTVKLGDYVRSYHPYYKRISVAKVVEVLEAGVMVEQDYLDRCCFETKDLFNYMKGTMPVTTEKAWYPEKTTAEDYEAYQLERARIKEQLDEQARSLVLPRCWGCSLLKEVCHFRR
jgi:hypothetical protein